MNNDQPSDQLAKMGADAAKAITNAIERFPVMLQAGITEARRQAEEAGKTIGETIVELHKTATGERRTFSPSNPGPWPYDALARQEWPHVPLMISRAYAAEYVRTGQRP